MNKKEIIEKFEKAIGEMPPSRSTYYSGVYGDPEEIEEYPVAFFYGWEMEIIEEYLAAEHKDGIGFHRSWEDQSPPKFNPDRKYSIYLEGGGIPCFSRCFENS